MSPKLIVLGAGRHFFGESPFGVREVESNRRVLDIQLAAFTDQAVEVLFVGGYDIEEILSTYPDLEFVTNNDWESTGSSRSLALALNRLGKASEGHEEVFICYADILFRDDLISQLMSGELNRIQVATGPRLVTTSSKKAQESIVVEGVRKEFVGLLRVPRPLIGLLAREVDAFSDRSPHSNLADFFNWFSKSHVGMLEEVNACGLWAHVESGESVARFMMGTKADTLQRLARLLTESSIVPLVRLDRKSFDILDFSVESFVREHLGVQESLVVRSSFGGEDGFEYSAAGQFESVLRVAPSEWELRRAISKVFESYRSDDPNDEVLIQGFLASTKLSGVLLTRVPGSASPYRVLEFNEGSDTAAVTSGSGVESRIVYVSRSIPDRDLNELPGVWRRLVRAAQEIEQVVMFDCLDIEFAVDESDELKILQVRPLVVEGAHSDRRKDSEVGSVIAELRELFPRPKQELTDSESLAPAWSVMSDWNPAEMIGRTPSPLAFDLYRTIITDFTWAKQRSEAGYQNLSGQPLMRAFGGHAYIDVRNSLRSLVPAGISEDLSNRLVEFALKKLVEDPSHHDKVEFELLPTSLDLTFEKWRKTYLSGGVCTQEELTELESSLRHVTRNIIDRVDEDLEEVVRLENKCREAENPGPDFSDWLCGFLELCSGSAALRFAHLARSAFVAVGLMKSLVNSGVLSEARYDELQRSLNGIGRLMSDSAKLVRTGQLPWAEFVDRFGHLRPGTYDILSPEYRDDPDSFLRPFLIRGEPEGVPIFAWTECEREVLSGRLTGLGIGLDPESLLHFCSSAVFGREFGKFVMSRFVSAIVRQLRNRGREFGVEDELLSSMPLDLWMSERSEKWGKSLFREQLLSSTEQRYRRYSLAKMINLPPVILDAEQLFAFEVLVEEPSFITLKKAQAKFIKVQTIDVKGVKALEGRIVGIESADPGYDFLFGQGIAGLVTAFGGPNSHMAIRSAEYGIPAVIGIGAERFARLVDDSVIEINCATKLLLA